MRLARSQYNELLEIAAEAGTKPGVIARQAVLEFLERQRASTDLGDAA